jgi:hypothetical protein
MNAKVKATSKKELTWNAFAQTRQPKGMPLNTTDVFNPAEVKEIATNVLTKYKKLSFDKSYQEST